MVDELRLRCLIPVGGSRPLGCSYTLSGDGSCLFGSHFKFLNGLLLECIRGSCISDSSEEWADTRDNSLEPLN